MRTKEKEKEENKPIRNKQSLMILKTIFILLVILVLFLLYTIITKKSIKRVNLIIPVIEKEEKYEFGIDSVALSKEDKKVYIFKLTNYREDTINKEEMPYHIVVENHTNNEITLKQGENGKDLMTEQTNTVIEGKLGNKKKEEVYYYVELVNVEDQETDEFIYIQVIS